MGRFVNLEREGQRYSDYGEECAALLAVMYGFGN